MNKILLLTLSALLLTGCASTGIAVLDGESFDGVSISTLDYNTECSFGVIENVACTILSIHNPDVDNSGSKEDIWEVGGLMTYLTVAEKYNISSTDPDDTLLGSGARTLLISGLNSSYDRVAETINLDGTNTVQSIIEYIRPTVIVVNSAGTSQNNEGVISAMSANSGHAQLQIDSEESLSKSSHFTVPRGETMILKNLIFGATKGGGQNPIVEFRGKRMIFGSNVWTETFDFKLDTSVENYLHIPQSISNEFPEKSDFRVEAQTSIDNTDVEGRIYMMYRKME